MDESTAKILIMAECKKVFEKYNGILNETIRIENVNIKFTLRGRVAGSALGYRELNFNAKLAVDNIQTFLTDIVPHEVAHLYQTLMYPMDKDHGPYWRRIMVAGGYAPDRCHKMNVSKVYNPVEKIDYTCPCGGSFKITRTMHTRIQNGTAYNRICNKCKGRIYPK